MFLFGKFAVKSLQSGEILSNNEIMHWKTNEKKADDKTTLFHDGICHEFFWKNASWDTIRSSSGFPLNLSLDCSGLKFVV